MPAYITITARLARPPEVRNTNSGTTICNLTLPNDTGWGDNKQTSWWTCTLFGKRAEAAAKHLQKDQWVTVNGQPSLRTYEKRDGSTGFSLEVKVSDWAFCGPKVQQDAQSGQTAQGYDRQPLGDLPF
jgi:single-strand DNA-binding protein